MDEDQNSQEAVYRRGLENLADSLKYDRQYTHYKECTQLIKHDNQLENRLSTGNKNQKTIVKAHRMLNNVQECERTKIIAKLKKQDENEREEREEKRLKNLTLVKKFKQQQRNSFMPMYKGQKIFIEDESFYDEQAP